MQNRIRYLLLLTLKFFSRLFYDCRTIWVHPEPPGPWDDLRVLVILNHTSLFEWLYAGAAPNHLLKRIAERALVPAADVTISRPLVGRFLKLLAPQFVSITREPDHTWEAVLDRVDSEQMVVILPEGRMMRANGLDKRGQRMTVRGGIADILRNVEGGRMLLAYSHGLHHIQIPGQRLPRLFKKITMSFELVDIAEYRDGVEKAAEGKSFKKAVIADLESRRAIHCYGGRDPARPAGE